MVPGKHGQQAVAAWLACVPAGHGWQAPSPVKRATAPGEQAWKQLDTTISDPRTGQHAEVCTLLGCYNDCYLFGPSGAVESDRITTSQKNQVAQFDRVAAQCCMCSRPGVCVQVCVFIVASALQATKGKNILNIPNSWRCFEALIGKQEDESKEKPPHEPSKISIDRIHG